MLQIFAGCVHPLLRAEVCGISCNHLGRFLMGEGDRTRRRMGEGVRRRLRGGLIARLRGGLHMWDRRRRFRHASQMIGE